jgi:hypothetical protein
MTGAKASGEGMLPVWRNPAVDCSFVKGVFMSLPPGTLYASSGQ